MTVVVPLVDQKTTETHTVTLECELSKPNKPVTWYKDGAELTLSDAHYTITCDDCKYSLTIQDCTLDDGAQYSLRCGDADTSANLTVGGN